MKNILILSILALLLASCYQNAPNPDFNLELVVSADTMVSILTDIHMADGMINIEQKKGRNSKELAGEYFYTVLERHRISAESFDESVRFYSYHTEQLDNIYEQVITKLSVMESLVTQPDSLR